jgi:hypothetical protein
VNYQITATNSPTSFGASGLPGTLSFDPNTGLITGSLTALGSVPATITASNVYGTGTGALTINVFAPPPVITSATAVAVKAGQPLTYQITATNSPTSYRASGLPSGIVCNGTTGLVSGSTTIVGITTATVTAINSTGSGSAQLAINILSPYGSWQTANFSSAISGTGDFDTPANDGIPNLLKYALGLDPYSDGSGGLPTLGTVQVGNSFCLTLTYTQVIADTDIDYVVEVSPDMAAWTSGTDATRVFRSINSADGLTKQVTVRDLTPVDPVLMPSRYIRLRINRH